VVGAEGSAVPVGADVAVDELPDDVPAEVADDPGTVSAVGPGVASLLLELHAAAMITRSSNDPRRAARLTVRLV
jgi:hypothetical protein